MCGGRRVRGEELAEKLTVVRVERFYETYLDSVHQGLRIGEFFAASGRYSDLDLLSMVSCPYEQAALFQQR
jgi:hypothetical protein